MSAEVVAFVPVKGFAGAKSRLASVLDARQRAGLALAMARDVLAALAESSVARILVVGPMTDIIDAFGAVGRCELIDSSGAGLNEDLEQAAAAIRTQGATRALIVHGDLPWLTGRAIDRFIAQVGPGELGLAPCRRGLGTNALLVDLPLPLRLVFGCDSRARFIAAATKSGLPWCEYRDSALASDVDEPGDYARLLAAGSAGFPQCNNTAAWLRRQVCETASPHA